MYCDDFVAEPKLTYQSAILTKVNLANIDIEPHEKYPEQIFPY